MSSKTSGVNCSELVKFEEGLLTAESVKIGGK